MADVTLPRHLVALFPGTPRRLDVDAATVRDVVAALDARAPGIADRLLAAGPVLREHLRVFVDVPVDHWAAAAIAHMRELELMMGDADGRFVGDRVVFREEIDHAQRPDLRAGRPRQLALVHIQHHHRTVCQVSPLACTRLGV